jgi:hypothetical protein
VNPAATSFVLGYHGCDRAVAERVLAGHQPLKPSDNDYDWLADGIYFWEHNAQRAYEFARQIRDRPYSRRQRVKRPAVVGAIIDLANCLNLLDSRYIEMVRFAHQRLTEAHQRVGTPLPLNAVGDDLLLGRLDCQVLRVLHASRAAAGEPPFDTARAVFPEGGPLYENAGFRAKNHFQLCVRNPACVKGYFRPLGDDGRPLSFV